MKDHNHNKQRYCCYSKDSVVYPGDYGSQRIGHDELPLHDLLLCLSKRVCDLEDEVRERKEKERLDALPIDLQLLVERKKLDLNCAEAVHKHTNRKGE